MAGIRPLLPFPEHCRTARFLRREKRFTVIVTDPRTNEPFRAHTNNTGSMLGLLRPGTEVLLSPAANPKRKLPYTLELVKHCGFWVGVNTATPNAWLQRAWETGALPEVQNYTRFKREAPRGESRLDARLDGPDGPLWIEAKNVTLAEDEVALFPDAPTERGRKHLHELMRVVADGEQAALFFCIQRPDARCFGPADMIDSEYAAGLYKAMEAGVQIWPYQLDISPAGIGPGRRLPVQPPSQPPLQPSM